MTINNLLEEAVIKFGQQDWDKTSSAVFEIFDMGLKICFSRVYDIFLKDWYNITINNRLASCVVHNT